MATWNQELGVQQHLHLFANVLQEMPPYVMMIFIWFP